VNPEVLVSAPGSGFQRAALSPDGRLVAVAGHRQSLVLDWNEPTRIVHFARERAQSFVAIDPGNQWVAAASAVGFGVAIWDTRDGRLIRQLIAQDNARIAISPDGRTLATATPREWVWWDTDSWQPRRRVPLGLLGGVPAPVAFSPDGRLFAIAATRTDVDLLDAHTGEARATLTASRPAESQLAGLQRREALSRSRHARTRRASLGPPRPARRTGGAEAGLVRIFSAQPSRAFPEVRVVPGILKKPGKESIRPAARMP
jgi:WD40 repeat protein